MSTIRTRNRINNNFALDSQREHVVVDYAQKVRGMKIAEDAVVNLGKFTKVQSGLGDKERIVNAIEQRDYNYLREVSSFFFESSGIYARLCRYLAFLLTYDWIVTPYVVSDKLKPESILDEFSKVLMYLDNINTKTTFANISLEVVKTGVYYGIVRENSVVSTLQQLPSNYCRSRYKINNMDAVEFNVKYFDDQFRDYDERVMVLKSFPKEFVKAYLDFKAGTLTVDKNDRGAWFLIDPNISVRFTICGNEMPLLIPTIPAILDLDEAQDVDKKKTLQELLKIVIQKMPLSKDGELIFEPEEAREMHNTAVNMLSRAIGVDVLTTFADTEVANLSDRNTAVAKDSLAKVERGIFNEGGISQMLFATDGNLALDKSVANDEALMFNLLNQYENWLNFRVDILFNKNPKKLYFKVFMPRLTIYNYEKMAKLYKEQAQLGYSKMLPAIALGQSQSTLLATILFENKILELHEAMVPLQMSSTMSNKGGNSSSNNDGKGRPEKPDDQKSDKTIQNQQSAK